MNKLTDFAKGIIAGVVGSVVIFGVIIAFQFFNKRERTFSPKELIEYAERQIEVQALCEDYGNRDPVEFLELPGVGGAVDGAAADFIRKRDEAVQRFRSGLADR
jgi:hypothetical protein